MQASVVTISTGSEGVLTVGVTGRLTVGTGVDGCRVGTGASFFGLAGCVVAAGGGGIRIDTCVRGGEVLRGRVGVGVALGLGEGSADGLIMPGGLMACGGSAPGEWGCSAMTTPVTAAPLTASVAAVRA